MMVRCADREFTFEELKAAFREFSTGGRSEIAWLLEEKDRELLKFLRRMEKWDDSSALENIAFLLDDEPPLVLPPRPSISKAEQLRLLTVCTREKLRIACESIARQYLAEYFQQLCSDPEVRFHRQEGELDWSYEAKCAPWYFVNVADALLAFIDRRKAVLASRLAETEITTLVFEWMGVAHETGRAIVIEGNSRFGKTEAIKLWCDMNPGIARLVNTPATNALGDLLREVARALGIDSAPGRRAQDLRDRIEYVLRFSQLLLCFDESNFLLPGSYSKNTTPARLNWVRRSLMDRKTPAVFVYTPQTNQPAKKRFVKATGYTMEQFDERILMTVQLPNELCEDDLIAVAKIHFGKLHDAHLRSVVHKVLATERNYISDLEKIATLANYKAKAAGRTVPLLADINAALANVMPVAKPAAELAPQPAQSAPRSNPRPTCRVSSPASLTPARRVASAEPQPFVAPMREVRPAGFNEQPA